MTVYIAFGTGVTGKIIIQVLIEQAKHLDLLGHSRCVEEAISVTVRQKPELLILEDTLIDGRGIDVVQQVIGGTLTPVIIMISTNVPPPLPPDYESQGIDLWYQLPQETEQLRSTLRRISDKNDNV
ncbi:MAG TPA: hypothetical protein VMH23_17040 [Bacteroidota bacterium]|nr:hypothetical protein [Bacteroidota bacterium]